MRGWDKKQFATSRCGDFSSFHFHDRPDVNKKSFFFLSTTSCELLSFLLFLQHITSDDTMGGIFSHSAVEKTFKKNQEYISEMNKNKVCDYRFSSSFVLM